MSKRFADTNKYKKPFMRSLPGPYKLFWDFLYLECDHTGVWHKDFEIAQLYIGRDMVIDENKALELFNTGQERVKLSHDGSKWFLLQFAEFQYGKLNPDSKVHIGAIMAFEKFGLTPPLSGKGIGRLSHSLLDKDKAMDKEKDKETSFPENADFKWEQAFNTVWARYPNKDGRKEAERSFRETVLDEEAYLKITKALNNYLRSANVRKGFVKNGSTWFSNWQDWIDFKGDGHGKRTTTADGSDLDKLLDGKV